MSVPVWEATLPQYVLQSGANGGFPDTTIKTTMDAGPNKKRRRFTAGIEPFKGDILCTREQFATFQTFFNTTLLGGALRFSWVHPLTGAACEMRFVDAPTWQESELQVKISLSLEILP